MTRRRNSGESLIETMFALLVGSVSVMLLATMISSSARLIRLGEENAGDYTASLNGMNDPDEEGAAEIRFDGNDDLKIDDGDTDYAYTLPVKIKSFQDSDKTLVISYDKD